ncbi:MAG: type IV toxin-antitoxin system AbiEi family antitoxin domain-containing protein [Gemmatimonadota bacterium]
MQLTAPALELATAQHGVVARRQLRAANVPRHLVDRGVASGWLQRIHRGVYGVGPPVAPYRREMAAALACGDGSAVSHMSAAVLWGFMPKSGGKANPPVHVTIGRGHARPPGIEIHRGRMSPGEATTFQGIPITTPERTLLDLASAVPVRDLERALGEALALRLADPPKIRALVGRYRKRAGARHLAGLVQDSSTALTRSEAERRFLKLIRQANLPIPETNVVVRGFEVDFFWRDAGLVAEVDGYAFHRSAQAFEVDRRRDSRLTAARFRVIRVTWKRLEGEPLAVVTEVAQALGS